MDSISSLLTADHRHCDELFAAVKEAVAARRLDDAAHCFEDFLGAIDKHIRVEEEILFPAFEARTGNTGGPTHIMCLEHEQMRKLFAEMTTALRNEDADQYLGLSKSLAACMQQHGLKEEQVLYPWADRVLGAERDEILQRMRGLR